MASRIASGKLLLTENKLDEAATAYESVIALSPEGPVEESVRQEAVLGKSRIMIARTLTATRGSSFALKTFPVITPPLIIGSITESPTR